MEEKICSVCRAKIESEEAAILTLGGFGNPRYLCDSCASDFDAASSEKEVSDIDSAIDRISKKMTSARVDDGLVLKTVSELMASARERREQIRLGEYDFSEDELPEENEEIPKELLESDEDVAAERLAAEKNKKYDKITNIICAVLALAALGFFIYRIIKTYFI